MKLARTYPSAINDPRTKAVSNGFGGSVGNAAAKPSPAGATLLERQTKSSLAPLFIGHPSSRGGVKEIPPDNPAALLLNGRPKKI